MAAFHQHFLSIASHWHLFLSSLVENYHSPKRRPWFVIYPMMVKINLCKHRWICHGQKTICVPIWWTICTETTITIVLDLSRASILRRKLHDPQFLIIVPTKSDTSDSWSPKCHHRYLNSDLHSVTRSSRPFSQLFWNEKVKSRTKDVHELRTVYATAYWL